MRLKIIYNEEKYLINFNSDSLVFMKEYLKEFFDIKLDISLELDGFKVTQGSLKDDDIVNIVKCTKKRPRYSSSSSSPSSSSVSSDSSSEEEQASATTTIPPHSGTSKTHKRNARNKKKLKFQKFENKRVIPYSSLPTNRIPNNIKVTSIDVENANFEPGNNTTHVDWRDLDVNEEVEQVHQQQEGYQADAEQSYMDISSAPPPIPLQSLESLDILLDINFPDNELKPIEQFKAYLGGFKEIDSTVDHFKAIANEKMSRGETLTELPPVGSFIAYNVSLSYT